MFATVRRLKTQPGKAEEVGALITAEYVPLLDGVEGFVSYTLVALADDEISSLGLFETAESAHTANDLAKKLGRRTPLPLRRRTPPGRRGPRPGQRRQHPLSLHRAVILPKWSPSGAVSALSATKRS